MENGSETNGTKAGPTDNNGVPKAEGTLSVTETLQGKNICLIGSTGFVGKVALSMLLCRYPNVNKVFALVRPGMGNTAADRFFKKVITSPAFDPLRQMWGDGFDGFLREKVIPIAGDIGRDLCNFDDDQFAEFEQHGGLDVIINSAGLVSFAPSLESAIRINANGAKNCLEAARRAKAKLVHVSTCFVAGVRDGEVWEDEPVVGYFPRQGELIDDDFDAMAEIADCQAVIQQVRDLAKDRKHISHFRERATETLKAQRRDYEDPKTLRLTVARERKLWVYEKLTQVGVERSEHWGWPNTYTYTKSLGEQVILADKEVSSTIVRPAIVESALRFPFPGWNEGFNTTAPLVYLMLKGQRQVVAGKRTPLDIIPVDHVCAALISATAALCAGVAEPVYQVCSSDANPVFAERLAELSGLVVRKHRRELAAAGIDKIENKIRARLESFPVRRDRYNRYSAPAFKRLAERASKLIDNNLPEWGAPRLTALAARAKDELARVSSFTGQVDDLMELFAPFTHDRNIVYRADNTRALYAKLDFADQQALPWDPEAINWRHYWFDIHFPGLLKWVFPILDDDFGKKPRSVYTHKDLLEMFDATAKLNRHRVAMRLLPEDENDGPTVYTYQRVQDLANQGAANLRERGIEKGDRVSIMSENRPEWGISYFAALKAGATAVPLDSQLSLAEVVNLLGFGGVKLALFSDKIAERLLEDEGVAVDGREPVAALGEALTAAGSETAVCQFDDILVEPSVSAAALIQTARGTDIASLIFTSGTTGQPKGVMLTHKNFTSMAAKLSQMFNLYRHDGLLSVLPLHHTFEFSAGFLMPLLHGSQINYLEEIDGEALTRAFRGENITGMVGVPALWQLLYRKIYKRISDRGSIVKRVFDALVDANRLVRDKSPWGIDFGKVLFYPVHRALGGRLRLLISGGSALSPELGRSFRGLGFRMFEGYGMTEASPVLTVQRPGDPVLVGSVGRALPGVDVRISDPDPRGVGEVIATGPTVMKGYWENEDATGAVLSDGWLHTGDLGRLDDDGNLYIVGRKKEMILGSSGENIYPDELEELYRDFDEIKELSVVGVPTEGGGETVGMLVVCDYEFGKPADDDEADAKKNYQASSPSEVRAVVREHIKSISAKLPLYKRVKIVHLVDHDLEKTSTRKIKRREVVTEIERLERAARVGRDGAPSVDSSGKETSGADAHWLLSVVASVSQRPLAEVTRDKRMEELGFDSLMMTELAVALEAAGVALPDASELSSLETVGDLERFAASRRRAGIATAKARRLISTDTGNTSNGETDDVHIPAPLVSAGRRVLDAGQRAIYERVLHTKVVGSAYVPPVGGYIIAANHSSHLDMGLVKHTLGDSGDRLVALAAKDYFFDDPVRKTYFENFTNLVPMERHGSLRESLRVAAQVIEDGYILLIFPEGTRSSSGEMVDFKPSLGYLSMRTGCGILPMFLAGTHDALPKGGWWLGSREIGAHIGPYLSPSQLVEMTNGMSRADGYRAISNNVEKRVRSLCPDGQRWVLGSSGRDTALDLAKEDSNVEPKAGSTSAESGTTTSTTTPSGSSKGVER